MPITIKDSGRGNVVDIAPAVTTAQRGSIRLRGDNNVVRVGDIRNSTNLSIDVGSSCRIEIADSVYIGALRLYCDDNATATIGRYVGFSGTTGIGVREGRSLRIGEGALLGDGVSIATSDLHSVFDLDTGERLNHAADIVIGSRVWLGARVTVLKGVTIGEGCVVGTGAVVTKDIPPHCLAAGVPARVVRERIIWDQRLLDRMPGHVP